MSILFRNLIGWPLKCLEQTGLCSMLPGDSHRQPAKISTGVSKRQCLVERVAPRQSFSSWFFLESSKHKKKSLHRLPGQALYTKEGGYTNKAKPALLEKNSLHQLRPQEQPFSSRDWELPMLKNKNAGRQKVPLVGYGACPWVSLASDGLLPRYSLCQILLRIRQSRP